MSARLQVIVIGLHLGVGVAVLMAVTVLTALQVPVTPFTAGIFGAIIGLAGGGAAATATLGTALNGKSAVDPSLIANQQQIIREGQNLLATHGAITADALSTAAEASQPPLAGAG